MDSQRGFLHSALLLIALGLCAACAGRDTRPAPQALPAAWSVAAPPATGPMDADWYRGFGSEELDRLESDGVAGNLDLLAATARVRQAMARSSAARAALQPGVLAEGTGSYYSGRSGGTSAHELDWSALLSASYELDFWGRNRASAQSAAALARASAADRTTVLLTTEGSIASTYLSLLALRERQAVASEDLAAARNILAVLQARRMAGAVGPGEVASQRALVATLETAAADLAAQESAVAGTLAVLSGHDPEGFEVAAHDLQAISEPAIDVALPSDLLRRRPDLLSAEAALASAHADVAVARAAFLPTISLTAGGGVQSPALQAAVTTLAGTGPAFNAGASLLQAVFDGGQRRAVREQALGREQEMLANYRNAIRNALLDVETALAARQSLQQQQASRSEGLGQTRVALESARARHEAGAADFIAVLDAQRTLHAARDADIQYRLARLLACVTLFKAVGGGWPAPATPSTAKAPHP